MTSSFGAGLRLNVDPAGAVKGSKAAEQGLDGVKSKAKQTEASLKDLGNNSEKDLAKTGKASAFAAKKVHLLATAASAAVTAFAVKSVGAYRNYNTALSEVSTLIDGTEEEMGLLDGSAKRLAATFGGSATNQVNAFYQAISAGAGSVAEATSLLDSANRLAVGGVTDVLTSVDALTTVMNAYKSSGLSAARASDILFTGVKKGKTTIAELNSALGQVVPTSSSLGIGLDQVTSAVAALTSSGQSTAQAVTGIRQAMVSVLKPTSEAQKLAKELGLDFSTTALSAKGLSGFLADVSDKTGGSQDALAKMFGSVEALNAVLALTGDAGAVFEDSLEAMATASGATDEAFEKVSKSLSQRLNVQIGIFNEYALITGERILGIIVPALEAMTSNIDKTLVSLTAIGAVASFFFPVAGALLAIGAGAAFLSMKSEEAKKVTYSFTTAADQLTAALGDEIVQSQLLSTALGQSSVMSVDAAKKKLEEAKARYQNVNAIIAEQRALVTGSAEFQGLTGEIASAQSDAQAVAFPNNDSASPKRRDALEAAQQRIVDLINKRQEMLIVDQALAEQQSRSADNVEALATALEGAEGAIVSIGGGAINPITTGDRGAPDLEGIFGSGSKGSSKSSGSATDALLELSEAYELMKASIDPAYDSATKFKEAQDLIDQALANGLITNGEYAETLGQIEEKYGDVDDAQKQAHKSAAEFLTSIVNGSKTAKEAIGDLAATLRDKLLNQGFEQLLGALLGGSSGGGKFLDFLFNANGNAFSGGSVQAFANGGVVSSATPFGMSGGNLGVMGEAGPEAILPLSRGSNGKLGVQAQMGTQPQQSGVGSVDVNVVVSFNGEDGFTAYIDERSADAARSGSARAVATVRRHLQGWDQEISRTGTLA